jgi:pimeloyl-ACP methyl ester carboxylesterase
MKIRRSYCDGPHGQMHLRIAGEGAPLLLMHQSPLSGAMFEAVMPQLAAAGFQAVAVDTPGFGQSDLPPEGVGIHGFADSMLAAFDAMGWAQADVLGHHTGASVAAALAARHSERVGKTILNGVALLTDEDRAHFSQFRFDPLELKPDGSHLLAAWNQRLAASPGWSDLRAMHRYVVEMLANWEHYGRGFSAAFAHDLAADLKAMRGPALILTNTGEDLYQASKRAHALRPDFAFAELERGTHDIVDEQPEAWVAAVIGYLKGE